MEEENKIIENNNQVIQQPQEVTTEPQEVLQDTTINQIQQEYNEPQSVQTPMVEPKVDTPQVQEVQPIKKNNKKYTYILLLIAIILLVIGFVLLFSNNKEKKNENTEPEKKEIDKNKFNDITEKVKSNTGKDKIYIKEDDIFYMPTLFINDVETLRFSPLFNLDKIYSIENNYLVIVNGTGINSQYLYLYSDTGEELQQLYIIDENYMIIEHNDKTQLKIKDNIIETSATRLNGDTNLLYDVDGKSSNINICNQEEIDKIGINDDYVVSAKYQLIYSNNKFDIKIIPGNEKTLKQAKEKCTKE
jgi:hypothetical protein